VCVRRQIAPEVGPKDETLEVGMRVLSMDEALRLAVEEPDPCAGTNLRRCHK